MAFLWFKKQGGNGQCKIGENRLVFLQMPGLLRDLKEKFMGPGVDVNALIAGANLPTEYVQGMTPLENRVKQLEAASARKGVKAALLGERGADEKLKRATEALSAMKAPVQNGDEFYEATIDVGHYDRLLDSLRGVDLDQLDLTILLDEEQGIRVFLEPNLIQKLETALTRMVTADAALAEVGRPDVAQMTQEKVAEEEARLQGMLEGRGVPEGMTQEDLELVRLGLTTGKGKEDRRHRQRCHAEKVNLAFLADRLSYEEKLKLTHLLLEAREIKLEQMRQYLRQQYEEVKVIYSANKRLINPTDRNKCDHELQLGEKWFERLKTAEACKDLNQRLEMAKDIVENPFAEDKSPNAENLRSIEIHRPAVAVQIRERFAKIKQLAEAFTPQRIADMVAKTQDPLEQRMLNELAMANPLQLVQNFEQNQMQALDTMSPSELWQLRERVKNLHRTYGAYAERLGTTIEEEALHPERMNDGQKATAVIRQIQHAISWSKKHGMDGIKEALETFGPIMQAANPRAIRQLIDQQKHVITVPHSVFEAEYRQHTREGSMVFHERDENWAIVLDEEAIQDPKNLINLRKQLTHELRHVEFERNAEVNAYRMAEYQKDPAAWESAKQAALEVFNKPPAKSPPNWKPRPPKASYDLEDWTPEAIGSELYAMEEELKEHGPDDTPLGRLSRFLIGLGGATMAMPSENVQEYIRGYEGAGGHGGGHAGGEEIEESQATGLHPEGGGSYAKFKDDIDFRRKELRELQESEYLEYMPGTAQLLRLMQNYLKETESLNEQMRAETEKGYLARRIEKRLAQLKDDTDKINQTLGELGARMPNQRISLFSRFWVSTHFLSISDVIKTGKDVVEFFKREHERKEGENAARLGMALFGNTDLARESKAQYYKAEEHNVEEWQKRYEHLDAWELMEIIDGIAESPMPSKHQLKALLRILAKKGRIDWRHQGLWKVLNKMQMAVHLTPGDPVLLHNPTLMRQKLHTALGKIWDYDEFLKLNRENEDAYEGNKKKFEPIMDAIQDQLTLKLEQLLREHRANPHHSRVSPEEYEEAMQYAIEKGKSSAEAVMFYLIVGQAEGILRSDRGMVLDKMLNTWPGTQWIYHKKPPLTQADYKAYAMKYFRGDYERGTAGWQFKNFYVTQVMNDEMYIQRVRKSVSERGWDHDWSRTIIAEGEASTVKRWLQGRSGNEEVKDTAIENGVVGLLMAMEENARSPESLDYKKHFKRMMGNFAMMDGILNNVCPNQQGGAPFTRMKPSIANANAREGDLTHHGDWVVSKHMDKMRKFLIQFDSKLFGEEYLGNQYRASHEPDALAVDIRQYLMDNYASHAHVWRNIKTLFQVFERMEDIIDAVTTKTDEGTFLNNIRWLRGGLDESEYGDSGGHH